MFPLPLTDVSVLRFGEKSATGHAAAPDAVKVAGPMFRRSCSLPHLHVQPSTWSGRAECGVMQGLPGSG